MRSNIENSDNLTLEKQALIWKILKQDNHQKSCAESNVECEEEKDSSDDDIFFEHPTKLI